MCSSDLKEDGEITNVDEVFLLEVNLELVLGQGSCGKVIPCPVVLAIHDFEQCVEEPGLCQS